MSNQSSNTLARPSDAYPDCPECETDLLVDGVDYAESRYYCHGCGEGFRAPGAFRPPDHERQVEP